LAWACCAAQLLIPVAVASAQSRTEWPARWPYAPARPSAVDSSPRARVDSQLHFSATIRVVRTAPMALRTVVTVANRGRARAVLEGLAACPLQLRVYAEPPAQAEPVYDGTRLACILLPGAWAIEPGGSRRFTRLTKGAEILGDSLAPGRYRVAPVMTFEVERRSAQVELATRLLRLEP